jgi:hypothetical protein
MKGIFIGSALKIRKISDTIYKRGKASSSSSSLLTITLIGILFIPDIGLYEGFVRIEKVTKNEYMTIVIFNPSGTGRLITQDGQIVERRDWLRLTTQANLDDKGMRDVAVEMSLNIE